MDYAGTNYPALTDDDTLYTLKAYTEALRAALMDPQDIPNSTNLNSLDKTTVYIRQGYSGVTLANNYPAVAAGMLEVFTAGICTFQRYTTRADSGNTIYNRGRYNAVWSAWAKQTQTNV